MADGDRERRRKLVDEALRALDEANAELGSLVALHQRMLADTQQLSKLAGQLSHAIADADAQPRLQELKANFNLMQLQIGQKIDEASRQFTVVSNVMKTRHDTAKNSISNIR